jgi:hypothetical protein
METQKGGTGKDDILKATEIGKVEWREEVSPFPREPARAQASRRQSPEIAMGEAARSHALEKRRGGAFFWGLTERPFWLLGSQADGGPSEPKHGPL